MDVTQVQAILRQPKNISNICDTPSSTSGVQPRTLLQLEMSQTYGSPLAATGTNPGGYETLFEYKFLEQVFTLSGTGTATFAHNPPAGATVFYAGVNFDTSLSYASSGTCIGIGLSGTTLAGSILNTGTLGSKNIGTGTTSGTNNMKTLSGIVTNTQVPLTAGLAGGTLYLAATNTSGTATGTATGTVRAVVGYKIAQDLAPHP